MRKYLHVSIRSIFLFILWLWYQKLWRAKAHTTQWWNKCGLMTVYRFESILWRVLKISIQKIALTNFYLVSSSVCPSSMSIQCTARISTLIVFRINLNVFLVENRKADIFYKHWTIFVWPHFKIYVYFRRIGLSQFLWQIDKFQVKVKIN